jgi:mono/diheme cytochrome c family protein
MPPASAGTLFARDAAEAALTEVPEHLLQRSRARRAAMGLGGDDAGAAPVPATTSAETAPAAAAAATPAVAPEPEPPAPPEIVPAYIQAARTRKKIPFWAVPVVAFTPIWVLIFALTLDKPTPKEAGPVALGDEVYAKCSGCHGAAGGGASGPALNEGKVVETFPNFSDQLEWVILGSQGFLNDGRTTYGAQNKPVEGVGVMPAWDTLTAQELIAVVRHEREELSGEEFDPAVYDEVLAMVEDKFPDRAAEFEEAVAEFKVLPPDA